jgi:very-long-chain enoyl-CoA reductase
VVLPCPSEQLIPARQRITLDKTAFVDDDKTLDDYGVKEGDSLFVKDLGPQISWRTVFLVEYVSPSSFEPELLPINSLLSRY